MTSMIYSAISKSWPYLLLLALWYVAYFAVGNNILIPDPIMTVASLGTYVQQERFWISIRSTMGNLLTTWLILQLMLAVVLILIVSNQHLKKLISSWANMFQSMPTFAILIAIIGLSKATLYVLILFANFWVGTSYLLTAVTTCRSRWAEQLQNLRWNTWTQIRHVYIYAMLPYTVNIASITWSLCWRTLLAVEIMFGGLGSQLGLGVLMMEDRQSYNTEEVWGILLLIIGFSVLVNYIFDKLKNKIKWK